jgi:hypothetical protein
VDIVQWIPAGIVLVGFFSLIVWVSWKVHHDDDD